MAMAAVSADDGGAAFLSFLGRGLMPSRSPLSTALPASSPQVSG